MVLLEELGDSVPFGTANLHLVGFRHFLDRFELSIFHALEKLFVSGYKLFVA